MFRVIAIDFFMTAALLILGSIEYAIQNDNDDRNDSDIFLHNAIIAKKDYLFLMDMHFDLRIKEL
jgi:hypothetical protein